MNYVFMFKNQKSFRNDSVTDLKMLKISIKQWYKLFKDDNKKIYICGSYSYRELDEITDYLGDNFMSKYGINFINVNFIPPIYSTHKSLRVNYQMLSAYEYLGEPMVLCTNDVFPIKLIDESYLNKEYKIRYADYRDAVNPGWWVKNYIKAIEYFNEHFDANLKTVYEGHSLYYADHEFMKFCKDNPELLLHFDRDTVLILWLQMNGETVYKPGFGSTTYHANKWLLDKKTLQHTKVINVTLPNAPKCKQLLKKITVK